MKGSDFNYKALWLLSVPSIIASVLEPLAGIVDTALVGQLSTEWLAALALSVTLLNSFTWAFNFLVHTSTQAVSDALGKNDQGLIFQRIKIALFISLIVGGVSGLGLFLFRDWLYPLISQDKNLFPIADEYFVIRLLGHPFSILYITLISILRGFAKIKESFYILATTTFLNIFLSYLFLYPLEMGISGAALGTILSNALGFLITSHFLIRHIGTAFIKSKIQTSNLFHFGKNSLDMFGRSATLTICFFLATRFAAGVSTEALGAHQVLLQLWLFSSFFLDGIAITGNIVGANLYAQKEIEITRSVFSRLLYLGGFIGLIFTLVFAFARDPILSIFSKDQGILVLCQSIWPWIFLSQMISSMAFVYDGLMFGLEGFQYLRKHMIIGALVTFLPISLLSLIYDDLMWVWAGLVCLNVYRGISGFNFVKLKLSNA